MMPSRTFPHEPLLSPSHSFYLHSTSLSSPEDPCLSTFVTRPRLGSFSCCYLPCQLPRLTPRVLRIWGTRRRHQPCTTGRCREDFRAGSGKSLGYPYLLIDYLFVVLSYQNILIERGSAPPIDVWRDKVRAGFVVSIAGLRTAESVHSQGSAKRWS